MAAKLYRSVSVLGAQNFEPILCPIKQQRDWFQLNSKYSKMSKSPDLSFRMVCVKHIRPWHVVIFGSFFVYRLSWPKKPITKPSQTNSGHIYYKTKTMSDQNVSGVMWPKKYPRHCVPCPPDHFSGHKTSQDSLLDYKGSLIYSPTIPSHSYHPFSGNKRQNSICLMTAAQFRDKV